MVLRNNGFDKLIKEGSNLIFTVDCGTMSFETINTFSKKNYDISFRSSSIRN